MTLTADQTIKAKIEEAVAGLVSVRADGDRVRIALPLLYPSGSGSAVEVMVNGDNCFVSDFGFGAMETEMYGADPFYESNAKKGGGPVRRRVRRHEHLQDLGFPEPPRRSCRGGRECVCAGRDLGDNERFGRKGAPRQRGSL